MQQMLYMSVLFVNHDVMRHDVEFMFLRVWFSFLKSNFESFLSFTLWHHGMEAGFRRNGWEPCLQISWMSLHIWVVFHYRKVALLWTDAFVKWIQVDDFITVFEMILVPDPSSFLSAILKLHPARGGSWNSAWSHREESCAIPNLCVELAYPWAHLPQRRDNWLHSSQTKFKAKTS